ncbi:hypothetical protein J0910_30975 [Nocardiopsis sp. CNT-189]|uniref:hypothetical protein n=1 Tax=Nocardiopsis oceanisediminis TaxID=2816862 RepID=UPI003B328D53
MPPATYLTTQDVGEFYTIGVKTVTRWERERLLPASRMILGAHMYPADAIQAQWNDLNPGVEHPGCPLLTRGGIAAVRKLPAKLITQLSDVGHLPTVTIPSGRLRIPETSLERFRDSLGRWAQHGGCDEVAARLGVYPGTAYQLVLRFGAQERGQL